MPVHISLSLLHSVQLPNVAPLVLYVYLILLLLLLLLLFKQIWRGGMDCWCTITTEQKYFI